MLKRGMTQGDIALYSTSNVTKVYFVMLGVWRIGGCMHSSYIGETVGKQVLPLEKLGINEFCHISVLHTQAIQHNHNHLP